MRTFQRAFNHAPANGVIDVLDPADYGPLAITHGITIQGHGFGGITQNSSCPACAAIAISATNADAVMLTGLLIDGGGTGQTGISIKSGQSVQILNSVVRRFNNAIIDNTATTGRSNLLIEDTVASENSQRRHNPERHRSSDAEQDHGQQ
jgi:hypothetical protein